MTMRATGTAWRAAWMLALRLSALGAVPLAACVPADAYLGHWVDEAKLAGAPTAGAQDGAGMGADADKRDASSGLAGAPGSGLAGAGASAHDAGADDSGAEVTDAAGMLRDAAISPSACAQLADDAVCDLGDGVRLPEELTLLEVERAFDFAAGASMPAGRYRVTYVDGCRRFEPNGGWTVHGSALTISGTSACWVVDGTGAQIVMAPGTAGFLAGEGFEPYGAFATYPECVAANCALAPVDFDFAGGTLGLLDTGDTNPVDDERGEAAGGRSPTYRLTRLDACP